MKFGKISWSGSALKALCMRKSTISILRRFAEIIDDKKIIFLAFLGWVAFWPISYFLHSPDKENYATNIFQFSNDSGIRSSFLGLNFADLGLAFGTNLPLLGFFDLTPLPLLSATLGVRVAWFVYASGLVFLCNYVIVKNLSRLAQSKLRIFIVTCLLTGLSPAWMDSYLYNDWPGTWSASVFSVMAWTILFTSLYSRKMARLDTLLFIFFSVNAFAIDPGYFPVYLLGIFSILIGFGRNELACFCIQLRKNIRSDFLPYLFILFFLLIIFVELLHFGGEFKSRTRSLSDSPILNEVGNFFMSPFFAYHPRGIGIYFPLVLASTLLLFKRSPTPKLFTRYIWVALIMFVASCIPAGRIIMRFDLNPEIFFFYPSGGFFLRDITVFLLIILLFVSSRHEKLIPSLVRRTSEVVLIFVLAFQLSFPIMFGSHSHSGQNLVFPSTRVDFLKDLFQIDHTRSSSGIAFTEQAIEKSRTSTYSEFWMSTDFQQKGDRLLTASTKLQSKDFFNTSKSTFQASTIFGDAAFWCGRDTIRDYWVDYVVTAKSEVGVGQCRNSPIRDLGNLRIYRVNHSVDSAHQITARVFKNGGLFTSLGLPVLVKSDGRELALEIPKSLEKYPAGKIKVVLPIEYSNNLRARVGKELVVLEKDERGFSEVNLWNSGRTLFVYYEATLAQKIRIISTYSSLGFLVFYAVSFRRRLARKSKNL